MAGKASWENDLSIDPIDSTNSRFNQIAFTDILQWQGKL
jgi:hypothetical protein